MIDLSHFHEHGYQFLEGVVDLSTTQTVRAFLLEERDKTLALIKETIDFKSHEELISKINSLYEDEATFKGLSHELKTMLSGHFSLECRLNSTLHLIPKSPIVQEIYNQIYPGKEPRMHLPPTARFVLPGNQFAAAPVHQDVSYNKHLDDFFVLWVPFCEIDDKCGGVIVHHGTGFLPEQINETDRKFWLKGIPDMGYPKVQRSMKLGDALLLNKWVIHQSAPNTSDRIRLSTDLRFFHGKSEKHYLDMKTWTPVDPTVG